MATNIDLGNCGIYHFNYQYDPGKHTYMMTLEKIIECIASHLRGHCFLKEQRAELVVIANDAQNHIYVINEPTKWALDKFANENGGVMWEHERIDNEDIHRIVVRNMVMSGKESEILVAHAGISHRSDYDILTPEYLNLNTQELGALVDELMQLHMFRIGKSAQLKWLRKQYRQ